MSREYETSREIKFRAWNERKNRFISLMDDELVIEYGYPHFSLIVNGYIKINQYTGLKDKNGVEVFEGDILKVWDDYICTLKGFIEYNEDGCRYRITNGRGYDTRNCIDLDCDLDIEVVGNIYENPERLEAS